MGLALSLLLGFHFADARHLAVELVRRASAASKAQLDGLPAQLDGTP